MSPRRSEHRPYHHGDLRAALISAASEVAAREGVDAIRVVDLARAVGVSGAAPFRHFPTRLALLVAVAEEGARRMAERLDRAAMAVADPLEAQRVRGVAYVRFAVEEPGWFRVLSQPDVIHASELLRSMDAASGAAMDRAFGGSASVLAARALTYGLARMIVDGLLGPVSADEAERLAWETTGVLGAGLAGRATD